MKSLTALLILLSGTLFLNSNLSAHGGDSSLVHACVANSGAVKIIGPQEECKINWTTVDWAIQGTQGIPGPIDTVLLGRIGALESQIVYLQSKIESLEPPVLSVMDVTAVEETGILRKTCGSYGCGWVYNSSYFMEVTVTFVLNKASTSPVQFNYQTVFADSAVELTSNYGLLLREGEGDYLSTSGSGYFSPGETTVTKTIKVLADQFPELDEYFRVRVSDVDGANVDDPDGGGIYAWSKVTILNDDIPDAYIGSNFWPENQGSTLIWIKLNNPAAQTGSVDYTIVDGNAYLYEDFNAQLSGTITWQAGEKNKSIPISIIDDNVAEGRHTFTVVLSNPVNISITSNSSMHTIVDDDVVLSISDVSGTEGEALPFVVSFSEPVVGDVMFKIYSYPDTATVADYIPLPSRYTVDIIRTIPAGQNSITIPVQSIDDALVEGDESFKIHIYKVQYEGYEPAIVTGTIIDND